MRNGIKDQKNLSKSRVLTLLLRAKKDFFNGKISQAAYLWEKVLETDPENEKAQVCRLYVRKNSMALRAKAQGKDVDLPAPPEVLNSAEKPQKTEGKRFSATEDLSWSDLEAEEKKTRELLSDSKVDQEGSPSSAGAQEEVDQEAVPLPPPPASFEEPPEMDFESPSQEGQSESSELVAPSTSVPEEGGVSSPLRKSHATARFNPEIVSGKELAEGLRSPGGRKEDGDGLATDPGSDHISDDAPTVARDPSFSNRGAFEHALSGTLSSPDPKGGQGAAPSTTLSGMPSSRLLPKDFSDQGVADFSDDAPTRSRGASLPEYVEDSDVPQDDLGADASTESAEVAEDAPTKLRSFSSQDRAFDTETDDALTLERTFSDEEPTLERSAASVRLSEGISFADRESEALLDPQKGLEHARALYNEGFHQESLKLCEIILEKLTDKDEVTFLIERNRHLLEGLYMERLGDLTAVPQVNLAEKKINDVKMDHKTAFLLTRIDGMLTLEEVIDIAGMSRLDAAKMLVAAIEEGIIKLED